MSVYCSDCKHLTKVSLVIKEGKSIVCGHPSNITYKEGAAYYYTGVINPHHDCKNFKSKHEMPEFPKTPGPLKPPIPSKV